MLSHIPDRRLLPLDTNESLGVARSALRASDHDFDAAALMRLRAVDELDIGTKVPALPRTGWPGFLLLVRCSGMNGLLRMPGGADGAGQRPLVTPGWSRRLGSARIGGISAACGASGSGPLEGLLRR
jgi:hypothetical protein